MAYVEYKGASTQYTGTSFTRTLVKKDGTIWEATESAYFSMVDTETGGEVTNDLLTKSGDNLGLILEVGKSMAQSLVGRYKLLVYLEDSVNTQRSEVLAEYIINYEEIV